MHSCPKIKTYPRFYMRKTNTSRGIWDATSGRIHGFTWYYIKRCSGRYIRAYSSGCLNYPFYKNPKCPEQCCQLHFQNLRLHICSLHWLPIEQRIEHKRSFLCFKIISHQASNYLSDLLHLYTLSRHIRSFADTQMFRIPPFRTTTSGQRSFSYQAPAVSVRLATSVISFNSSLKKLLFS